MATGRELRLMERPPGKRPIPGRLDLVEVQVPEPGRGQALVRNLYQAVDPGLLLRQQDIDPPDSPDYDLGATLTMRGFFAFDDEDLIRRFEQEFPPLVTSGQVILHETIVEGGLTELMPAAEAQLAGAFSGRVLLRY